MGEGQAVAVPKAVKKEGTDLDDIEMSMVE
jgi:hypothetical protein